MMNFLKFNKIKNYYNIVVKFHKLNVEEQKKEKLVK